MEELSYAIVTPYSMRKSRTGGIVSRLISRTGLDLVGRANVCSQRGTRKPLHRDNRHRNRSAAPRDARDDSGICAQKFHWRTVNGQRPRVLLLVFRGEDAVEKIHHIVGHIVNERTSGETIRDTYGDYIADESGKVTYFEPAVMASLDARVGRGKSQSSGPNFPIATAEFSTTSSPIRPGAKVEKSLVLIKPDNFKFPKSAPGRSDRSVFAHRALHHRIQSPPDECGAGGRILRSSAARVAGQARRRKRPRGVGGHRGIHVRRTAERDGRRSTPRARHARNASRSFTRAKTRCAKSATCSGRPIRARRRRVRFGRNLARPS